jgi:hypothetical protein
MTASISCEVIFNSERAYFAKATVASCPSLHRRLQSSNVVREILGARRVSDSKLVAGRTARAAAGSPSRELQEIAETA